MSFRDLIVYKKSFAQAMEIFELSKEFPPEEKYQRKSESSNSRSAP